MTNRPKPRLLIFIVAYNAEKTITWVLDRIPTSIRDLCDVEVLMIDDASRDRTFYTTLAHEVSFPIHVLRNPVNQGYGGNQKIGYHFAIDKNFDFVALVHGDGQYAPELLPELVKPLVDGEADAVFGSRMVSTFGALKGGMPLYKYVGNRILTFVQNFLLGTSLSEFHTGYRIYATKGLSKVPFELNTNDFHFDTEIIIQFIRARLRIRELSIPTYYGDEISHVNGMKYAWDVVKASIKAKVQDFGIYYDRRFDCVPDDVNQGPIDKAHFDSSHSRILARVPPGAVVVEIGSAATNMGAHLKAKGHRFVGIDRPSLGTGENFIACDVDIQDLPDIREKIDVILLIDVMAQLKRPEDFIDRLRLWSCITPKTRIMVSTGNIGFATMRLQLLLGSFNYAKRGLLDLTHTRLFTFRTLRGLFEQSGFNIVHMEGVPAPFPRAFGAGRLSRTLLWLNQLLIRVARSLFSFEILIEVAPRPTLSYLLRAADEHSSELRTAAQ